MFRASAPTGSNSQRARRGADLFMKPKHSLRWTVAAASAAFFSLGIHSCTQFGFGSPFLFFRAPLLGQLSLPQGIELDLHLSVLVDPDSLVVQLDGAPIAAGATLPDLDEGRHTLKAQAELAFFSLTLPLHHTIGNLVEVLF